MDHKTTIIVAAVTAVAAAAIVAAKVVTGKRCEKAVTQLNQKVNM